MVPHPVAVAGVTRVRHDTSLLLKGLAESGVYKPVIDRTYPFERIADAHAL